MRRKDHNTTRNAAVAAGGITALLTAFTAAVSAVLTRLMDTAP